MDSPGILTCRVLEVSLYNFFVPQKRVLWQVIHTPAISSGCDVATTCCLIVGTLNDEDLAIFHNASYELHSAPRRSEQTLCALDLRLRLRHKFLHLLFEYGGWDMVYELEIGENGILVAGRMQASEQPTVSIEASRAAMRLNSLCHIENCSNVQIGSGNVMINGTDATCRGVTWFSGLDVLIEVDSGLCYQYPRFADGFQGCRNSVSLTDLFRVEDVRVVHGNVKLPQIRIIIPVFQIAGLNEACMWNRACEEFFCAFHKKVYGRFSGVPQRFFVINYDSPSCPYPQFPAFPPFAIQIKNVSRIQSEVCMLSFYPLKNSADADYILGLIPEPSSQTRGQLLWNLDVTELNDRLRCQDDTSVMLLAGRHTIYVVNFLSCLQMLFKRHRVNDHRDMCSLLSVMTQKSQEFVLWVHNRLMATTLTVAAESNLDWVFMNGPFVCLRNREDGESMGVQAFRGRLLAEIGSLDLGTISGDAIATKICLATITTECSAFFSAYDRIYYSTTGDIWGNPSSICNWLMLIPFLLNKKTSMDGSDNHALLKNILKILFTNRRNLKFWTMPSAMLSYFTDVARAPIFSLIKSDEVLLTTEGAIQWKKGWGAPQLNYARYVGEISTWLELIMGDFEQTELSQAIHLLHLL